MPGFDAGSGRVETKTLQEEDWSENWKQYYKPFTVGEKLAVTPYWEPYEAEGGRVVVTLEPGAAFGTGQHETTFLCLDLCQKYGKEADGYTNYVKGANVAGFMKVARAMMAQGIL